ncbi:MAG: hypothetical protein K6E76_02120 [Patescibacteria group bacterium]|nr:hypothetical protein [Patescibacteria group bacterium]
MDADEEITEKLSNEITTIILEDKYDVCIVPINIYFMKMRSQTSYQPRLFKK